MSQSQLCNLRRAVQAETIPGATRRRFDIEHTKYKDLEEYALLKARKVDEYRKTKAGQRIIGRKYVAKKLPDRTEAQGKAFMRAEFQKLSELHGDPNAAAAAFFKQFVPPLNTGQTCEWPCMPSVALERGGELKLDCKLDNPFRHDMSMEAIQNTVLRLAKQLRIPIPKLPGAGQRLQSGCRALKRGAASTRFSTAQRVMAEIDAPYLMQSFKGALMWHCVGCGKSCAAMLIANFFLNQGWRVIWCSSAALKMGPAVRHFFDVRCHTQPVPKIALTKAEEQRARTLSGQSKEKFVQAALAAKKNDHVRKLLNSVSYATLSNALSKPTHTFRRTLQAGAPERKTDPLYKTLILFDEPHKLQELKGAEKASWDVITRAMQASYRKSGTNSVRSVFMDATPMVNQPGELFVYLNALEPDASKHVPTDLAGLKRAGLIGEAGLTAAGAARTRELAKGTVSYLNMTADYTRFARPVKFSINNVTLSKEQLKKIEKDCRKMVHKRDCVESSMVAINMPRGKYSADLKAKLDARAESSFPALEMLTAVIQEEDKRDRAEHASSAPFKHAIFTNVANATHAENILKVLQSKGYVLVDETKPRKLPGHNGILVLSGYGITPERKAAILDLFNSPDNAHGEYARLLLIDGRFREGIDVFDTRHMHLLQPLNDQEERQALGRVLRMCGSTRLPETDNIWQVRLHQYAPEDATGFLKELTTHESSELDVIAQLQEVCKKAAFDALVFKAYDQPGLDRNFKVTRPDPREKAAKAAAEAKAKAEEEAAQREQAAMQSEDSLPVVAPARSRGARAGAGKGRARAREPCPRLKVKPDAQGNCPSGYDALQSTVDPTVTCCKKSAARGARATGVATIPRATGANAAGNAAQRQPRTKEPCPRLKVKPDAQGNCPEDYDAFTSSVDPRVTCCKKKTSKGRGRVPEGSRMTEDIEQDVGPDIAEDFEDVEDFAIPMEVDEF